MTPMENARVDLDAAVAAERKSRVDMLKHGGALALRALPPLNEEKVEILGKPITFTTYAESLNDGRFLILIRSDEQRFWGIVSYGATDGFWVLPDGSFSDVSDNDVLDYFG
jgi:hypothetical protein